MADFPDLDDRVCRLSKFVTDRLQSELAKRGFKVLESSRLREALETVLERDPLTDPRERKKIGRQVGAEVVLVGTVSGLGGVTAINARFVEFVSGRILGSADVDFEAQGVVVDMSNRNCRAP